MTETINGIRNNKSDNTKFGGLIYYSDFNTNFIRKRKYSGSLIAKRIIQASKFDNYCRRNIEARNNQKPSQSIYSKKSKAER